MSSSLRDELQRIYTTHGTLTPRLVVDLARNPEHPLHARFEWDDSVAAEKWREAQAGELIRSVKVIRIDADPGEASVRQFVHLERPTGATYVPIEEVLEDDIATAVMLRQAERELKAFVRKYESLKGFVELVRGVLDKAS